MSRTELLSIEKDWKEITSLGNQSIKETREKALSYYILALQKAEKMMPHLTTCIDAKIPVMPIFLISCNNLAEVYCLQKQWSKADKMLKRGIYYIIFLKKEGLQVEFNKVLSNWLLKQLLLYKEFTERSNQPEEFKNIIEKLREDIF